MVSAERFRAPYTLSDRRNVPSSTFLHTPYSRVGLNEREAKAAGLDYVVKRLPVATVPKAQVMRRPEGMMKASSRTAPTAFSARCCSPPNRTR